MLVETYAKILAILAPLRSRLPGGIVSVKDLCRSVLAMNYETICDDVELPLDERCVAVWEQLTELLADVLGTTPTR